MECNVGGGASSFPIQPNNFIKDVQDWKKVNYALKVLQEHKKIVQDELEFFTKRREIAHKDPITFVQTLIDGKLERFPTRKKIPIVPDVDFKKYLKGPLPPQEIKKEETPPTKEKKQKTTAMDMENLDLKPGDLIRGRVFTTEKPSTYNKLWTVEEQARLEELLKVYPEEPIASHRWYKIAAALGNRTPRQVASRIQKYFQKLAKATKESPKPATPPETPTPGVKIKKKRKVIPNLSSGENLDYYFPPPVSMPEDEPEPQEDSSPSANSLNETSFLNTTSPAQSASTPNSQLEGTTEEPHLSDDDMEFKMISSSLDPELKDTPEYRELLELMKLRHSVAHPKHKDAIHEGYKCDSCGVEPIVGTRYRCIHCDEVAKYGPGRGVDLCQKCKDENYYETEYHSKHHEFSRIDEAEAIPYYLDHFMGVDTPTSYLDPKFMPL